MLFKSTKDEAISIHKKTVEKYNATWKKMENAGDTLYRNRLSSKAVIDSVTNFINSIANTPKEFSVMFSKIKAEQKKFQDTEDYAEKSLKDAKKNVGNAAAGVAAGAAVACMAPTAAMWVATTFGTASTGTAISTLTGAAATKAALAWLGGGALSAGGAGVAGGQALLAMAGPLGWGIAGASAVVAAASMGIKNRKLADDIMEEAEKITVAGAQLNETAAKISHLNDETLLLSGKISELLKVLSPYRSVDYGGLEDDVRYRLGSLVNNTLALAELLNKKIGEEK